MKYIYVQCLYTATKYSSSGVLFCCEKKNVTSKCKCTRSSCKKKKKRKEKKHFFVIQKYECVMYSALVHILNHNYKTVNLNTLWKTLFCHKYRLCQKKLYNFQFLIAGKVNKAQQQHFGGQNIIFMCVRRFLNGIILWSGIKVMVHWIMSGKNKVCHFRHYYESHGSSPLVKHTLI